MFQWPSCVTLGRSLDCTALFQVALMLQNFTLPEYMEGVEQCLEEEQRRVAFYLHKTTEEPLTRTLVKVMIEARLLLTFPSEQKPIARHLNVALRVIK